MVLLVYRVSASQLFAYTCSCLLGALHCCCGCFTCTVNEASAASRYVAKLKVRLRLSFALWLAEKQRREKQKENGKIEKGETNNCRPPFY